MGRVEQAGIILILERWLEEATLLWLEAEMYGVFVRFSARIANLSNGWATFKAVIGDTELSLLTNDPESSHWYLEPRELSDLPEYKELLGSAPKEAGFLSVVGVSLAIRVTVEGVESSLVPVGKVFLFELLGE